MRRAAPPWERQSPDWRGYRRTKLADQKIGVPSLATPPHAVEPPVGRGQKRILSSSVCLRFHAIALLRSLLLALDRGFAGDLFQHGKGQRRRAESARGVAGGRGVNRGVEPD